MGYTFRLDAPQKLAERGAISLELSFSGSLRAAMQRVAALEPFSPRGARSRDARVQATRLAREFLWQQAAAVSARRRAYILNCPPAGFCVRPFLQPCRKLCCPFCYGRAVSARLQDFGRNVARFPQGRVVRWHNVQCWGRLDSDSLHDVTVAVRGLKERVRDKLRRKRTKVRYGQGRWIIAPLPRRNTWYIRTDLLLLVDTLWLPWRTKGRFFRIADSGQTFRHKLFYLAGLFAFPRLWVTWPAGLPSDSSRESLSQHVWATYGKNRV